MAPDPPIVAVSWTDAWFDTDLEATSAIRCDYLVTTVGFLIAENPRFISVAQELLPDGDGFRAVTHIPKVLIEEQHELERSELS